MMKTNGNLALKDYEQMTESRENLRGTCRECRIKQKLFGLYLIVFGIILPLIINGDATGSLLLIPAGIALMITKEKLM